MRADGEPLDLAVIVPCRDVAATLGDQLEALAGQRWSGTWEVIITDDGSVDGTVAIAMAFAPLQGRLRVRAVGGRGVSAARNDGVRATTARSVAFCDGDDVVGDGWLAAMGDALARHPIVTGPVELFRLNDTALAASRGVPSDDEAPRFGEVPFARGNNGGMWRTVWEDLGGYDETYTGLEDIELSLRAATRGIPVHFERRAVVHYRYRASAGALWRQGRAYGRSRTELARRARRVGLVPPRWTAGARSWAWLGLHLVDLAHPQRRLGWLWVLASRVGAASGVAQGIAARG